MGTSSQKMGGRLVESSVPPADLSEQAAATGAVIEFVGPNAAAKSGISARFHRCHAETSRLQFGNHFILTGFTRMQFTTV
jgi:ABC-type cobalamin transport system ATPase subunit